PPRHRKTCERTEWHQQQQTSQLSVVQVKDGLDRGYSGSPRSKTESRQKEVDAYKNTVPGSLVHEPQKSYFYFAPFNKCVRRANIFNTLTSYTPYVIQGIITFRA